MTPINTVIEPAKSLALVELDVIKDELGIALDDTTQDARLSRYILQASAQIHAYCQRIFPIQTYRDVFPATNWRGDGRGNLVLWQTPVIEMIGYSDGGIATDLAEHQVDPKSGVISRCIPWMTARAWSCSEIIVDYKAGYREIPPEVEAAAVLLTRLRQGLRGWDTTLPLRDPMLRAREADTYGRQEYFGNTMPNTVGGMPADVAQMLELHVRPVFA